jgi:DNA-binding transcriptional ArsR family regulator
MRGTALPAPDRLVHEPVRLRILSALAAVRSASFQELKALVDTTDGNLSVHARKLEEAGYITSEKSFRGRLPRTDFSLTAAGRRAFEGYLDQMETLVRTLRKRG